LAFLFALVAPFILAAAGPELVLWIAAGHLTFTNNIIGPGTHIWSVAVEFQMYLVSPFFIRWLYKNQNKSILFAWVIFSISASVQIIVFQAICSYG
jgi:peptidoglycan/LPS O-acetylase OafA/YrhL